MRFGCSNRTATSSPTIPDAITRRISRSLRHLVIEWAPRQNSLACSDLLRELNYTCYPCGVNALGDRAPSRTTNVDHHHRMHPNGWALYAAAFNLTGRRCLAWELSASPPPLPRSVKFTRCSTIAGSPQPKHAGCPAYWAALHSP
jgi:hypothetical protein